MAFTQPTLSDGTQTYMQSLDATATNPTGTSTTTSADQQSAQRTIQAMLDGWGLGSLGAWAWQKYLKGEPTDAIKFDLRQTTEYKQRFSGMALLAQKGQAISEADYISKENADIETMRTYGIDPHFASRQELGQLIGNQVSTVELQNRLEDYKAVTLSLPQEVRDYAHRVLGLNTGDLIGLWLDPKQSEPLLRQKMRAAQVGGAAAIAGFNTLDPKVAAQLVGLGNTDFASTLDRFQKAATLKPLDQNLPGQVRSGATEQDLINAEVAGDANAIQAVQKEIDRRKGQFNDKESVATTQQGAVGLAPTNV